jgi:deazaflavin-dependent oxidoreductase (nitroreductase family)
MTSVLAFIRASGPITSRLLRLGMPMGPNIVLTVRGRTSGQPRDAPVAVAELNGRRWVVGTFGEVHWVRNLRAAGEATVRLGGHDQEVAARELRPAEAIDFFEHLLPAYLAALPRRWRFFVRAFLRLVAPDMGKDATVAAAQYPVFELTPR